MSSHPYPSHLPRGRRDSNRSSSASCLHLLLGSRELRATPQQTRPTKLRTPSRRPPNATSPRDGPTSGGTLAVSLGSGKPKSACNGLIWMDFHGNCCSATTRCGRISRASRKHPKNERAARGRPFVRLAGAISYCFCTLLTFFTALRVAGGA